jgi:hypothetical protein
MTFLDVVEFLCETITLSRLAIERSPFKEPSERLRLKTIEEIREALLSEERRRKKR